MIGVVFRRSQILWLLLPGLLQSRAANASEAGVISLIDFSASPYGIACLFLFVLSFLLIIGEEPLSLKKSKPMLLAGALIWVLVSLAYASHGHAETAKAIFQTSIEHFTELFLFLLAAMTFVNAMSERGVFRGLRQWMAKRNLSLRSIFWLTGGLTFILSSVIANLAVALLMVTVVMAVGKTHRKFVIAAAINIVVAANAGGVFTPFGDITTLMVWQRGVLEFHDFFQLALPALSCWLIPAVALSISVGNGRPASENETDELKPGAWIIVGLFAMTLLLSVCFEQLLHLPAVIGMMTGLGLLKLYGYRLKRQGEMHRSRDTNEEPFDIFRSLERSEWDTLMFLLGVVASVSGLYAMGYLVITSEFLYGQLSPTTANILLGIVSAFVENVPVMYAVLGMEPEIDKMQWLLVSLATGAGGSLLSIGSVAGVAVMGQARGVYTFATHLRWTWIIAIGFSVSIWLHLQINGAIA